MTFSFQRTTIISGDIMSNTDNICKFITTKNLNEDITPLNFVYEKNKTAEKNLSILSAFAIYIVTSGSGIFSTMHTEHSIKKGDIFITFPSMPFAIQNIQNLKYIYITFIGSRFNKLREKHKISKSNNFFTGNESLIPFWETAIQSANESNISILSESVILYTIARLTEKEKKAPDKKLNLAYAVKQKIDENYSDTNLSVITIAEELNYNDKYISTIFKKIFGTGFSDYLLDVRISHAIDFINAGLTNIKDIAFLCGFSDQFYFSKCFKKLKGIAPREFIKSKRIE